MDFRVIWLSGVVVATAATAACTAPDPGEITFSERSKTESSSSGGSSGGGSSSSGSADGGSTSSGGAEAGPTDPVFGTTQFAAGNPGQNANQVGDHAGQTPLEGKNCFQAGGCHAENNKKWGFAGTVYSTLNGGATVKNAEVRVSGPDGTLVGTTYTDDNGNFWYEGAKPPANARVGVRNATKSMVMTGTIAGDTGAQCNSAGCHGQTAMRIYLQ